MIVGEINLGGSEQREIFYRCGGRLRDGDFGLSQAKFLCLATLTLLEKGKESYVGG